MPVLIQPTSTDVEALSRLVHAEAANIAGDYKNYYEGLGDSPSVAAQKAMTVAYGSIIDQIINRVAASSSQYGTSIQGVIDKNNGTVYQYSALPDNNATTWSELPGVDSSVNNFVESHLAARANGQGSSVGGATHYYNPNISNPNWGDDLERKTGVGLDQDRHDFGTLPDTDPLPSPYTIDFGGNSSTTDNPIPPIPGHKPEFYGPPEPFGPFEAFGPWVPSVTTPFGGAENAFSPIVLDIDGSGTIELAALNGVGSVMWDIDQDGFVEASAWITGGDGLLSIDLNSDGVINDHGELFGGTNGYVTLAAYDTNSSGTITSADTQFGSLRVWVDDNANGYSEASELHTLSSLGITSISTAYSNVNYAIAGNEIKFESTFVMNGNSYTSVDAFFAYDNVNSMYVGDYTLDVRTLFLPTLRGYGNLPDLHIAMSLDEELLDMLSEFTQLELPEMMANVLNSESGAIADILFRWAGVDGVNPTSRGSFIDARLLEFLEEFMGKDFVQISLNSPNPNGFAAASLIEAWENAYHAFATRLAYQASGADEWFIGGGYNPGSDTFEEASAINLGMIESWSSEFETLEAQINAARFLAEVVDETIGIENLTSPDKESLDSLLPFSGSIAAYKNVFEGIGTINGDSDDNLLLALDSSSNVYSYEGDDTLVGSIGNDGLYGGQHDDILIGGAGSDSLQGGTGNDIYVFSSGSGIDYVQESTGEGTDTIRLSGYATTDVRLWTDSGGSLYIGNKADPTDYAAIAGATTGAAGTTFETDIGLYVEQIVFDDTTTWSLTGGLSLEGDSNSQDIFGSAYGDQINGMDGNDTLYGNRGNDTLIGGAGGDSLYGGAGDDVFDGGADDDSIDGEGDVDTVTYTSAGAGVTVNLATTTGQNTGGAGTDTILNVENVIGSAYNDTLTGNGSANIIEGGAGNDTLNGAGGTDTLSYVSAGAGITINLATVTGQNTGGAGTDTISSFENLRGSAYNDTLTGTSGNNVIEGGAGNDTINGQGGTDTLTYANAAGAVTVSLAVATGQNTVGAGTDTISNMENLTGSAYGDTLTGSTAANTIDGGNGDDTIEGGAGNDTLTGGSGTDTVSYVNAGSAVTVNLATTSGQNTVGAGTDTVSGFENMRGSAFNDTLTGNNSNNTIEGGAGNDTINGSGGTDTLSYGNAGSGVTVNLSTATGQNTVGAGTDTISSMENLIGSAHNDTLTGTSSANTIQGGAGVDTINAGGGADFLYGGAGADTLTGSTAGDVFIFEAATALGASDTITDFSTAQVDKLDVSDILSAYDPLSDAISDFVRITDNGTHSFLSVDADGGGNSFTQIAQLSSVTNLAAGATATEIELQAMITAGTLVV